MWFKMLQRVFSKGAPPSLVLPLPNLFGAPARELPREEHIYFGIHFVPTKAYAQTNWFLRSHWIFECPMHIVLLHHAARDPQRWLLAPFDGGCVG